MLLQLTIWATARGLDCQAGDIIFVDFPADPPTGGLGPDFVAADFSLTTGVEGKWLTVSLSGKTRFFPPPPLPFPFIFNAIGHSGVETDLSLRLCG